MLSIQEYVQHISNDVYPTTLTKLRQCSDPQAVAVWKQEVCRMINSKRVQGEPAQDFDFVHFNPQDEESKDALTFPQAVFL